MPPQGLDCPANRRARVGGGSCCTSSWREDIVTILAICLSLTPKRGVFRLALMDISPRGHHARIAPGMVALRPAGPLLSCALLELAPSYHEIPLGFS